jgi:hypothetical protein
MKKVTTFTDIRINLYFLGTKVRGAKVQSFVEVSFK